MSPSVDLNSTFKIFVYNNHTWLYCHILTMWFEDLLIHTPSVKRKSMQLYIYKLNVLKSGFNNTDFT